MPYFVYILYSHKDHKLYIGCTQDIDKRMKRHHDGFVASTKNRRSVELIHKEKCDTKTAAFKRERFLKSLWGGRFKNEILKKYIQNRASH